MARPDKQPNLLLHNLIGAMSYWGTTTRILLVGFVLGTAVLLHLADSASVGATTDYGQAFVYVMACLFLLDAGYVTIARALPFKPHFADKLALWLTLIVLSMIAVVPYLAVLKTDILFDINTWLFVITLFILALRLVLGMVSNITNKS